MQRVHLNPAAAPLLLRFADAFAKVWANLDVLAPVARAVDYRPPWQAATTTAVSA